MNPDRITLTKPHADQQTILGEARRFNILECGRRYGKTTLGEYIICRGALRGYPVAWFAPTYKYLRESWRRIREILRPIIVTANAQEMQITCDGGGIVDFWTHEDPDAGRGRKYERIYDDESSLVRHLEHAWHNAMRPTLTDYKGSAWFGFTPKGRGNFAHRLFTKAEQGDSDWACWRRGTVDNPFIDATEVEAARLELPEAVFKQEYLGIPSDDEGNPFGIRAIESCVAPLSDSEPKFFGVDLAKSVDWTVIVGIDEHGQVCHFERFQKPWGETTARVLDVVGDVPALVDSTGVGDPILEELARKSPNIKGFKFSASSKQQIMEGLASAIHQGRVGFPDGPIRSELETFEYEYRAGGGVRYSAPEGLHDDCVCALALAVHHAATAPRLHTEFVVVRSGVDPDDIGWTRW